MNLQDVRQEVADLLAATNANVYLFPPAVPMLPAVIVVPADPYVAPITLGSNRFKIRFKLTFAVAMTDNQASLNMIEELIFSAYEYLPVSFMVAETTNPQPVNLGQTDLLSCDLIIETIIER